MAKTTSTALAFIALAALGSGCFFGTGTDNFGDWAPIPDENPGEQSSDLPGDGAADQAGAGSTIPDPADPGPTEPGPDPAPEPEPEPDPYSEPEPDPDPAGACVYPAGPHSFVQGQSVPPMAWPTAIAGAGEAGLADLGAFFCDPTVNSVFVYLGTTDCPGCGEMLQQLAAQRAHFDAHGAKWVFIVEDAASSQVADEYVNRYGAEFGYRTNNADNSLGANYIYERASIAFSPWVAVIRTSDMTIYAHDDCEWVGDEPIITEVDLLGVAAELAAS